MADEHLQFGQVVPVTQSQGDAAELIHDRVPIAVRSHRNFGGCPPGPRFEFAPIHWRDMVHSGAWCPPDKPLSDPGRHQAPTSGRCIPDDGAVGSHSVIVELTVPGRCGGSRAQPPDSKADVRELAGKWTSRRVECRNLCYRSSTRVTSSASSRASMTDPPTPALAARDCSTASIART